MVFFLGLLTTGLNVLAINLFRLYIQQFSEDYNGLLKFIGIGAGFLVTKLVNIFLLKQVNELQIIIGFKSGVELNCLIFDKF